MADDLKALYDFVQEPAGVPAQNPSLPIAASSSEAADPALASLYSFVEPELKEEKYGSLGQQAASAAEGLAEGVLTSPISRAIETKLGISTPEAIRGREEVNPGIKGTAEVAGLVGSAFIPGGQGSLLAKAGAGAAKAIGAVEKASFLSKVSASAARAAFEGAIYQSGKEVGDMVISDPQAAAEFSLADVGLSAALGGVFGGAGAAALLGTKAAAVEAAPFLKSLGNDLQESAGAKALGFTKGQIKKLRGGQDEAKDIARTLMDAEIDTGEKIFTPFASADDLSNRVESLRVSAGNRMNKVYTTLDEAGAPGVSPLKVATRIDEELGNFWRSPINKGETAQFENILESVLMRGDKDLPFSQAQVLKEELKKVAYPNGKAPLDASPRVLMAQDAYRIVKEEIDNAVSASAKGFKDRDLTKELSLALKEYGAAKKAGRAIADRISSEQGNKMFGLTDTIAGIGLGSGVGLGPAGAAVALKKLAEKYGNTVMASGKDGYSQAMNKFVSAFGNTESANATKLGQATAKGFNTAGNAIKAVFNKSKEMPSKVIPILAAREKLDKLVTESVKNPDRLFAINDNNPVQEYSGSYAATSARAVSYLNSLKPKTDPQAPLDSRRPANSQQLAIYNRALDIAQQPLVTLKYVQEGSLTSKDLQTLQTIYPALYGQLQQRLTTQMVNAVSKGDIVPYSTRKALSLFLGQPLDSTLTPQAIQAAQPTPQGQEPQPQMQNGNTMHPAYSSVKGLNSLAKSAQTPQQAAAARNSSND